MSSDVALEEYHTFNSWNIGTSDLPEMYAQKSKGAAHTFKANDECSCYSYYVTLPLRPIALMPV